MVRELWEKVVKEYRENLKMYEQHRKLKAKEADNPPKINFQLLLDMNFMRKFVDLSQSNLSPDSESPATSGHSKSSSWHYRQKKVSVHEHSQYVQEVVTGGMQVFKEIVDSNARQVGPEEEDVEKKTLSDLMSGIDESLLFECCKEMTNHLNSYQ